MSAVERHDQKQIESLLTKGADPNAKAAEGSPVLTVAALNGDEDTVRSLIRRGANVNAASPTGRTPLLVAASVDGSYKTVKLLLDKGAGVNAKDKVEGLPMVPIGGGGETALINAAKNKDSRSLKLLIDRGAGVNAKDRTGGTVLTAAALFCNGASVKLLIEHGADVNASLKSGVTPVILASIRNGAEIVKVLLANGADRNAKDGSGSTNWLLELDVRFLVLFHVTRFIGIYFLYLHSHGRLPYAFAVPGGWGDIAVAGTALVVASYPLPRIVYLWNVIGLTDILLVVATAARLALHNPASMNGLTELPLIIFRHVMIFSRVRALQHAAAA